MQCGDFEDLSELMPWIIMGRLGIEYELWVYALAIYLCWILRIFCCVLNKISGCVCALDGLPWEAWGGAKVEKENTTFKAKE